jgi:nucleotide-binding universal stress UspA family protein
MSEPREPSAIFDRIVCGVDDSRPSLEAVGRAVRLRSPGGSLHLVGVVNIAAAAASGWSAATMAEELERDARAALERAREIAGAEVTARLVEGRPVPCLLSELGSERATLVCVGTHGLRRAEGILLGGVAATLLHDAPCPVLIARPAPDADRWPRSIAVGVDGSAAAERAAQIAVALAERFGAELRTIAATRGKGVDVDALDGVPGLELDPRKPVDALVDVSSGVELLVVGSRGLHGVHALGSVSERVAHRAHCSVLVIRP